MPKLASVAILSVFLLGSVLLIQQQGESYRDDFRKTQTPQLYARLITAAELAPDSPSGPEASRPSAPADPGKSGAVKDATPPFEIPPTTAAPIEIPRPDPAPPGPELVKADSAQPVPPAPAPAPPPAPAPAPAVETPAAVAKNTAPGEAPKQPTRITVEIDKDPAALTIEEERQIGRALNQIILQRHPHSVSAALQHRIQDAARPILGLRERKDIEYHFVILNGRAVNAFSHLGGYVYLNRGLFELLADDTELQFVLAHEIAHVDLRHDILELSKQTRPDAAAGKKSAADPLQRLYHMIATGHTDAQEFEADAKAYRQLIQLGHTRREALAFTLRFRNFVESNGLDADHRPPQSTLEQVVQEVDNHWYALPPPMARLDRLEILSGARSKDAP
jgi:Peptidase family M48